MPGTLWGQTYQTRAQKLAPKGHCQQLPWELRSVAGDTPTCYRAATPPMKKQMRALGPVTYPANSWVQTLLCSLRIIPKRLLGILQLKGSPEQKYTACASQFQHLTTLLNAFNLLMKPMEPKELLMGKCSENVNYDLNINTLGEKM